MKHIFLQDHKRCSTYISDDGEAILRVAKAAKANEGCFTVKAVNEAGVATSTCVVVVNDVGNVVDILKRRQTKLSTIDGFLICSLLKYLKQKSL